MSEGGKSAKRELFKVADIQSIFSGDRPKENRSLSVVNSGTRRELFQVSDLKRIFSGA